MGRFSVPDWLRFRGNAQVHSALGLVAIVLIAAPLVLPEVVPEALVGLTALAAAAAALTAFRLPSATPLLELTVWCLCLYTVVQLLPLPCSLVASITPYGAALQQPQFRLLGIDSACSVSLDSGATRLALFRWLTLASIVTAAGRLASRSRYRRRLKTVLVVSVALTTAVTLLHWILDLKSLYGLYQPVFANPAFLSPLINENNLASFLLLGVFPALEQARRQTRGERAVLWGLGALGMVALLTAAGSRGGVLGLAVGMTIFVTVHISSSVAGTNRYRPVGWLLAMVVAAVAVGLFASDGVLLAQFRDQGLEKLTMQAAVLPTLLLSPWTGVGRGAFSSTFHQHAGVAARYDHPENFLLQWASEWGPIASVLLLLVIARGFWTLRGRHYDVGLLAAVAAFLVHNLFGFATERAGIAPAMWLSLVLLFSAPPVCSQPTPRRSTLERLRAPRQAVFACSVLALLAAVVWGGEARRWSSHWARLQAEEDLNNRKLSSVVRQIQVPLRLHPAEPVFPLILGAAYAELGKPEAFAWLNRAMVLAPAWPGPHVTAARALEVRGRVSQAVLELRAAAQLDPRVAGTAACGFLARNPSKRWVEQLFPAGLEAQHEARWKSFSARLASCQELPGQLADRVDQLADDRWEPELETLQRLGRRSYRRGDLEGATSYARRMVDSFPSQRDGYLLLAQALARKQDPAGVLAVLEGAPDPHREEAIIRLRAQANSRIGNLAAMRTDIALLDRMAAGNPEKLARSAALLGSLLRDADQNDEASVAFERAFRLTRNPAYREQALRSRLDGSISRPAPDPGAPPP